MPKPYPVEITDRDEKIIAAKCSACGQVLDLGSEVGADLTQDAKLASAQPQRFYRRPR